MLFATAFSQQIPLNTLLFSQTRNYLMNELPYWNRTSGRDHLWVLTDDHGACDEFGDGTRVKEIAHSIFLTHFGYTARLPQRPQRLSLATPLHAMLRRFTGRAAVCAGWVEGVQAGDG